MLRWVRVQISCSMTQSSIVFMRSEEHTSELQSQSNLVCRLLLEKKNRVLEDTTPRPLPFSDTKGSPASSCYMDDLPTSIYQCSLTDTDCTRSSPPPV